MPVEGRIYIPVTLGGTRDGAYVGEGMVPRIFLDMNIAKDYIIQNVKVDGRQLLGSRLAVATCVLDETGGEYVLDQVDGFVGTAETMEIEGLQQAAAAIRKLAAEVGPTSTGQSVVSEISLSFNHIILGKVDSGPYLVKAVHNGNHMEITCPYLAGAKSGKTVVGRIPYGTQDPFGEGKVENELMWVLGKICMNDLQDAMLDEVVSRSEEFGIEKVL